MKKNLKSYAVVAVAVSMVTVGGSLSVLANSLNTNEKVQIAAFQDVRNKQRMDFNFFNGVKLNMNFEQCVADGIISQETADQMKAFMEQKKVDAQAEMDKIKAMTTEERKAYFESNKNIERTDLFTEMVNAGVLTQSEADAIKAAAPKRNYDKDFGDQRIIGARINMNFEQCVADGIISQETADKMKAFMDQKKVDAQAEMDKIKAMTAEERKAYFESNKNIERTDLFTEMVNAGVLTQTEADAIKAAAPKRDFDKNFDNQRIIGARINMNFEQCVADGIIIQETADQMKAFMEQKKVDAQAEMDKIKAMTDEERKAYFESNKNIERIDLFTEMVNAGVLTQTEADAIKAATPRKTAPQQKPSFDNRKRTVNTTSII